MRKKSAFTLVEVLGVTALIGILITATSITLNTVWRNNQIDVCESELREMTNGLKSYFTDYGNIIIGNDMNYNAVLTETLELLNKQYLPYELETEVVADDLKSVVLRTKLKLDPWNTPYRLSVYTYDGDDATSIPGIVVISSNGVDGKNSAVSYKNGDYGDDVVAVVQPKIESR